MDNKQYTTKKHKIRTMWDDILKLIALEEEILRRIERLEKSMSLAWREQGKLEE